ncbi:hypothetical protein QE152_g14043 [Popillia japonica]|uniref:Uncharacterized protein n=1 Tax=Popillia japonica TaxID=7064 RepID=A0AAW1LAH0_POPJA
MNKVGNEKEYKEVTGGKSRHTTSNDNGRRVVGFAFESNMKKVTGGKSRHTTSNDNGRRVVGFAFEKKTSKNVMDERSYRRADCDSDHMLVIMEMHQERPHKKKEMREIRKRHEVAKLKDRAISKQFEQDITDKLITKPHKEEIEEEWMQIEAEKEVAEKVLEKSKGSKPGNGLTMNVNRAGSEKFLPKKSKNSNAGRPLYLKSEGGTLVGDTEGKLKVFAQYFAGVLNENEDEVNPDEQ